MQILKIINDNNCQLPFSLGKELGAGNDGQVFELKNEPTKVIKFSILFDLNFNGESYLQSKYNELSKCFDVIKKNNTIFAKIINYQQIGFFKRKFDNNEQDYLLHYYIMEKCEKLSEDEKKVFHTILSHEDQGLIKKFSEKKFDEILFGLARGLDFDSKKIRLFYESVMASEIKHLDLHIRNIMKDSFENYKMIDFDRCILHEKNM